MTYLKMHNMFSLSRVYYIIRPSGFVYYSGRPNIIINCFHFCKLSHYMTLNILLTPTFIILLHHVIGVPVSSVISDNNNSKLIILKL